MAAAVEAVGATRIDGRTKYTIIQWNMQDLTYNDSPECGDRIKYLAKTLTEISKSSPFAACVMEEIKNSGVHAVEQIVNLLNVQDEDTFDMDVTGIVNPTSGGRQERYAIIWNKKTLGPLIGKDKSKADAEEMDDGYRLATMGIFPIPKMRSSDVAPTEFKIGNATISLERGQSVWKNIWSVGDCHAFPQFDRMPALFTFNPPGFGKMFHIMATHSATTSKNKHQNVVESSCLQDICVQAAEQGEYVILLGDFNTSLCETEFIWDEDVSIPNNLKSLAPEALNEEELLGGIKDQFLHHYYRGVDKTLPTNVYPFLSGQTAGPKHNDDIWLPKNTTPLMLDTRIYGRKTTITPDNQAGKVYQIPSFVLEAWESKTRKYYFEKKGGGKNECTELNLLLSKAWSDHRPISVRLKFCPVAKSNVENIKDIGKSVDDDEVLFKLVEKTRMVSESNEITKLRTYLVTKNILASTNIVPPVANEDDGPSVVKGKSYFSLYFLFTSPVTLCLFCLLIDIREEDLLWDELEKQADLQSEVSYVLNGMEIKGINITSGGDYSEQVMGIVIEGLNK